MTNAIDDDTLALARTAARAADDKQGADIRVIDVSSVLPIVGLFVVTSAGNPRLVPRGEAFHEIATDQQVQGR
ncbi:MAG: hypothetical protein EBY95_08720, partial [Actinobacteria bacterium]|nr:hypothetical protein [Actinomycetota bacterium]